MSTKGKFHVKLKGSDRIYACGKLPKHGPQNRKLPGCLACLNGCATAERCRRLREERNAR